MFIGSTNANADSSRSHAIMQVVLRDRTTRNLEGKLSFIDLAGSERGADRGDANTKTRQVYKVRTCAAGNGTNGEDPYQHVFPSLFLTMILGWKVQRST